MPSSPETDDRLFVTAETDPFPKKGLTYWDFESRASRHPRHLPHPPTHSARPPLTMQHPNPALSRTGRRRMDVLESGRPHG